MATDQEPTHPQAEPGTKPGGGRRYSLIIPVGPGDDELDRLTDLLASVDRFSETPHPRVILIDDAPIARELETFWEGATVIRTPLWAAGPRPDPYSAMAAGTVEALKRANGEFALKLDTDALIVGPFVESIGRVLEADPGIGMVGAYDRSPDGNIRDRTGTQRPLQRCAWPVRFPPRVDGSGIRLGYRPRAQRDSARRVLRAAAANSNYRLGAHCQGGAYAVSASLLRYAQGWDWRPWTGSGVPEDILMGLWCGATGLRMVGLANNGDPFGVVWRGLAAPPDELVDRGYSIVHSLKASSYGTEAELRAAFRRRADHDVTAPETDLGRHEPNLGASPPPTS